MENIEAAKTEATAQVAVAKSNLVMIGVGGCGAHAIQEVTRKCDPAIDKYLGLVAIESNGRVLSSCSRLTEGADAGHLGKWIEDSQRFRMIQLGDRGTGAGGSIEKGEAMARDRLKEIGAYLTEFDNAILIGGGGGGTCGAMPVIAQFLKEIKRPTYAILTMPTVLEGPKKAKKAEIIRDRMLELCPTALVNNEKVPNKKLTLTDIQREINTGSLFWALWLLKALLQEEGDVQDLDSEDWRAAIEMGNNTLLGFFDASRALEGFEDGLLGNPYLDPRIIKKASAADFWFEGKWPYEDIQRVVSFIREKMGSREHDEELELKWGVREKGVPDGVKTVGFIAFAKEGPDEDSVLSEPPKTQSVTPKEDRGEMNGFLATPKEAMPINQVNLTVNNRQVPASLSAGLAGRLAQFYAKGSRTLSLREAHEEFDEIQRLIKQETGFVVDFPVWLATAASMASENGRK